MSMNPLYIDREDMERIEAQMLLGEGDELPEVGEELDLQEAEVFMLTLGDDLLF